MMTEWWRSWHGAPTDPKWLSVARRANVGVDRVICTAWALMDCASQADDRGSITGFDIEAFSDFTGIPMEEISSIIKAISDKGMIVNMRFAAWDKRQPKRERPQDVSTDRVRAFRQRQQLETPCNATERLEKSRREKSRGEESRVDLEVEGKKITVHPMGGPVVSSPTPSLKTKSEKGLQEEFNQHFWPAYPNRVGKGAALKSYVAARKKASLEVILAGLYRYANKTDDRPWCHPTTWLNQERWLDEPAPVVVPMSRTARASQEFLEEIINGKFDGGGSGICGPSSQLVIGELPEPTTRTTSLSPTINDPPDWQT